MGKLERVAETGTFWNEILEVVVGQQSTSELQISDEMGPRITLDILQRSKQICQSTVGTISDKKGINVFSYHFIE